MSQASRAPKQSRVIGALVLVAALCALGSIAFIEWRSADGSRPAEAEVSGEPPSNDQSRSERNREFLESLPVYPGAERMNIEETEYLDGPNGKPIGVQTSVKYRVAASEKEIREWYRDHLPASCESAEFDQGAAPLPTIPGIPAESILRPTSPSISLLAQCGDASVVVDSSGTDDADGRQTFRVVVDTASPGPTATSSN